MTQEHDKESRDLDIAGQDGALLAVIEVGLGSLMYTLRVPMTGHLLSLNQGFFLSRSLYKTGNRKVPILISNISAILKSLSPSGKKLNPMIAISVQGFMYGFGTALLGVNVAGAALGSALMSLFAFAQPIAKYWLLFGSQIVDVARFFLARFHDVFEFTAPIGEDEILAFVGWVILAKFVIAILLAILARYLPESWFQKYQTALLSRARARAKSRAKRVLNQTDVPTSLAEKAGLAVKDLLHPLFVFSLALTLAFFLFSQASWQATAGALLRPLALGFVLFFILRVFPLEKLTDRLDRSQYKGFSKALRTAIERIRNL